MPSGPGCHACYSHWEAHHQYEDGSSTFESYCKRCDDDGDYKAKVERARDVALGQSSLDGPPEYCHEQASFELEVSRRFVVLSESELAQALGVPRVSKAVRDRLSSFSAPMASDPASTETLFAFKDPGHPHREARLVVRSGASHGSSFMADGTTTWRGESGARVRTAIAAKSNDLAIDSVLKKMANRGMKTLSEFVGSVKGGGNTTTPVKGKSRRSGSDSGSGADDDDDGDDDDESDNGCGDGGDDPPDHSPSDAMASGTKTPQSTHKRRPPVLAFSSSASASAVASSRKAPIVAQRSASKASSACGGSSQAGSSDSAEDSEEEEVLPAVADDDGCVCVLGAFRMSGEGCRPPPSSVGRPRAVTGLPCAFVPALHGHMCMCCALSGGGGIARHQYLRSGVRALPCIWGSRSGLLWRMAGGAYVHTASG